AETVQRYLATSGEPHFEVRHVTTLAEALRWLENRRFDLVLLDLSLPDSKGMQTLRQLRAKTPDTPVVVLTANDDGEQPAIEAIREGAHDYLSKVNVDLGLLRRVLRHAAERWRTA